MEPKKQGGNNDHVVIVTSGAEGASVKKFRIKRWVVVTVVICVCVLIGAVIGYFINEERIWQTANAKIDAYKKEVELLKSAVEEEKTAAETLKAEYENEIAGLNNKLTILSETINQNVTEMEELETKLASYETPTLLPLSGSASIEVSEELGPMCTFHATDGALIVATASGVVSELVEDPELGYKIVIDHGNEYVTVYYNKGEPAVNVGDNIRQGATLFIVEAINTELIYQIAVNGVYVNPLDIMQISG